jgi:hypothetical protein
MRKINSLQDVPEEIKAEYKTFKIREVAYREKNAAVAPGITRIEKVVR